MPRFICNMRRIVSILVALAFVSAGTASAKVIEPGDLRLCGASRCAGIASPNALRAFAGFFWGATRVSVAHAPRLGARAFRLTFRDAGLAGIVGGARLDRILVNGVNCEKFRRGRWYLLPPPAAREARTLAATIEPLRVTGRVSRSC